MAGAGETPTAVQVQLNGVDTFQTRIMGVLEHPPTLRHQPMEATTMQAHKLFGTKEVGALLADQESSIPLRMQVHRLLVEGTIHFVVLWADELKLMGLVRDLGEAREDQCGGYHVRWIRWWISMQEAHCMLEIT